MSIIQRTFRSLRQAGIRSTLIKLYGIIVDYIFDWKYKTNTVGANQLKDLQIFEENISEGTMYQPSRVLPLRKFFNLIQPLLPEKPVLVDLGSGKGRVMMIALEKGFHAAKGIEFACDLSLVAENNILSFKSITGIHSYTQTICDDVVNYEIQPEDNVFFMYNPFTGRILDQVMENLEDSLRKHPRKAIVIYHNPKYSKDLEAHRFVQAKQEISFWGYQFLVYSTRITPGKTHNYKKAFVIKDAGMTT